MSTNADRRDKALRRIAAALAIAEDPSAPLGEREAAADRAAELMTRHGIEEAQARAARGEDPEGLTIKPFAVIGADGNGQARGSLVVRIAEAMGCRAIHKPAPAPRPYTMILAGAVSDVDNLCRLLPLILAQAQYAAINTTDVQQRRTRGFLADFLVGYGIKVAERLAARRAPLTDEQNNQGAALVLADRAERLTALIARKFGELSALNATPTSARAAAAGIRAGRNADIGDPAIGR